MTGIEPAAVRAPKLSCEPRAGSGSCSLHCVSISDMVVSKGRWRRFYCCAEMIIGENDMLESREGCFLAGRARISLPRHKRADNPARRGPRVSWMSQDS